MILLKAIYLTLKETLAMWSNSFRLLVELFWCLAGILSLVLSVVLMPVVIYRKYAQIRSDLMKTKKIGKRSASCKKCRTA